MNKLAVSLLSLAVFATPGTALAAYKDSKLMKSVTEADLVALVTGRGDTIDEQHPYEEPSVRGQTPDGLYYELTGTACDTEAVVHCEGIMMQIMYDQDERVTDESIGLANVNNAALSIWWDKPSKTVGYTRYVVMDGGVTWLNLKSNVDVLFALIDNAAKYAFPSEEIPAE